LHIYDFMRQIAVLGSTGSIGKNVLSVARHLHSDLQVVALAARENIDLLEQQAREFKPSLIAVFNPTKALELQKRLPQIEVCAGLEGLNAVASINQAQMVVSALSGTIGLQPTITAIMASKNVALANKEALVSGGALIMSLVAKHNVQLIPIDSEHSAIFQCLQGLPEGGHSQIHRIVLTSSGGPFRTWTAEQLKHVSVAQALKHPTWTMGAKVTIDSSTLMNKGLEVIEAHWLFNLQPDKIDVIIHPQSIIHSLVEFTDASVLAQMGEPNMITPIQYALTYPQRKQGMLNYFDFIKNSKLEFYPPNQAQFRCLGLAYEAIKKGGSFPCYLNAANEVLVERFLAGSIEWLDIAGFLEKLMCRHQVQAIDTLENILAIDRQARQEATNVK